MHARSQAIVRSHAVRAAGVLALWVMAATPVVLGAQKCAFARLLHRPCPGCGMTRAFRLLHAGDVAGSLHMHPLALPVALVGVLVALSTIGTTLQAGSPVEFYRRPLGRVSLALAVVVYAAAIVVWGLRWFGFFGGPVPVG
jgi:hypothetical protein